MYLLGWGCGGGDGGGIKLSSKHQHFVNFAIFTQKSEQMDQWELGVKINVNFEQFVRCIGTGTVTAHL